MAHDDGRAPQRDNASLDYKTVSRVAGGIILLLCGSLWNIWNTNHDGEADSLRRANELQWERLRYLDGLTTETRTVLQGIKKNVEDQEVRIRALERRGDRR